MAVALVALSLVPWQSVSWHRADAPHFVVGEHHQVSLLEPAMTKVKIAPSHGTLIRRNATWWYRPRASFHGVDWVGFAQRHCAVNCDASPTRPVRLLVVAPLRLRRLEVPVAFGGAKSIALDSLMKPRSPSAPVRWGELQICQQECGNLLVSPAGQISVVGRTLSFRSAGSFYGSVRSVRVTVGDAAGFRATTTVRFTVARPTLPKVVSVRHYVAEGGVTNFKGVVTTTESIALDPLGICFGDGPTCLQRVTTPSGQWEINGRGVTYASHTTEKSCVRVVVTDITARQRVGRLCAEVPAPPVGSVVQAHTDYNTAVQVEVASSIDTAPARIALRPETLRLEGGGTTLTRAEGTYVVRKGRISFVPAVTFGGKRASVGFQISNAIGQRATGTVAVHVAGPPTPVAKSFTRAVLPGMFYQLPMVNLPGALVRAASPQLCLVTTLDCVTTVRSSGVEWSLTNQRLLVNVAPSMSRGSVASVRYRVTDVVGQIAEGVVTIQVAGPAVLSPVMSTVPAHRSKLVLNESAPDLVPWQRGAWRLCYRVTTASCTTSFTIGGQASLSVSSTGVLSINPVPGFHGPLAVVWLRGYDALGQVANAPIALRVR